jgi:hypothetical protein
MDTRQAAFGLLLLFPIHPNLKNLELCGAIVVSNDNFLISVRSIASVYGNVSQPIEGALQI